MEFIAKPTLVKVTIGEQTYELRKPTLGEKKKLEIELSSGDFKGTATDITVDWLKSRGLPEEAALQLEEEQALELIALLSGSKKN